MSKSMIGSRRSAPEIVAEILGMCLNDAIGKTAIMYRCNLSFEQLQRYLAFLQAQCLLEKNEAGLFCITPRGQDVLLQVQELVGLLRDLQESLQEGGNGI